MPRPIWRLIIDGPVPGAMNMAIDRAVLESRRAGRCRATVRLYRWERPTVTLGHFQKAEQVDFGACAARGFDVVRRPTGGRGVLHDDELTYAVVAHVDDGVPRSVAASYRHLCAALAHAYRELGVEAELTPRARGATDSGACYMHATQADLSLGAAKLSGSAQVWAADAVLQHGSFVRSRDVEAEAEVFRLGEQGRSALLASTATLSAVRGGAPSIESITEAAISGFEDVLGVRLELDRLSPEEVESAESFAEEHSMLAALRNQ